jgi:serine/threonine protein kinase
LIRFYGAYYDEGIVNLVLEYMDCGSLNTILKILKQAASPMAPIPLMPEYVISRIIAKVLKGL